VSKAGAAFSLPSRSTQLDSTMRYKLLGSTITPPPIALVSNIDEHGVLDAAPFSYFNVFGEDPAVVGISILSRSSDDPKDTGHNVRRSGEFVINLVDESTLDAMKITAIGFSRDVDEFKAAKISSAPSTKIAVPRIAESRVSLECKLLQVIEFGAMRSLAIGEVLAMHIADDAVLDAERGHVDLPKLGIVGRAGAHSYVRTSDVIKLAVPSAERVHGELTGLINSNAPFGRAEKRQPPPRRL